MSASAGKPRRILIIVQNLPVPFDRRVWQEATELARNGYKVIVICPSGKGYEPFHGTIDGVHIHRHPKPPEAKGALGYILEYGISLFWEFFHSLYVWMEHGFDVIHACNPPDTIFLIGGFYKYLFGKKFLFDQHDINPELFEAKFGKRGFFYKLICLCEKLTFRTADIVISTNESYRKIALDRGGRKSEQVFIVRSGPNLDKIRIMPPAPAHKNGRSFLIGYIGVIGQQEGVQYLIEAARRIIEDHGRSDVQFAIIGSGPALHDMMHLAAEKKLGDYITFYGRVPDETVLEVLNTADICINPDEVNAMNDKSTMNKIMEYMALGKPIVQFDVTEGRFSAQEASLYAKPNDARDLAEKILELLADPDRRKRMGDFGRKRVEDVLSWPHEAPNLLAAYRALFSDKA